MRLQDVVLNVGIFVIENTIYFARDERWKRHDKETEKTVVAGSHDDSKCAQEGSVY